MTEYFTLDWEQILMGYIEGIFPMGNINGTVSWYEANPRAVIPVETGENELKLSRSLRQAMNKNSFDIRHNTDFENVIKHCAEREDTWINELIISSFITLHNKGFGHSIEAWINNELVGGLYGVAFRGAFFGESMFYRKSNASKVCVVNLYDILRKNDFVLFDIQMMTPHFKSLGAIELSKAKYNSLLERAMSVERKFVV